ncbi:MAG: 30S ribosome-binding factor RbfA [Chloroflexota bacterium]
MSYRIQKINSLIRQEISDLLQLHIKDPRLGSFIAITEVDTASDLKHARIFVSFLGSDEERDEALKALTGASGFIRRELAQRIRIRTIPELSFHWDNSIEQGDRILRLIDQVNSDTEG